MGHRLRLLGPLLGLFCTAQLSTHAAHAEDASAAETAAARSLAVDGLKLAQQGNCVDAVPKLERAEKLYHSAIVSSRLGECYVGLGRLVEGTEILRKTLREPLPPDPQPALLKALERAQKTLDAAKPRIAGLTIKVAAVSELSVKVDGNAVAGALLDTEIPSDPGEHTVEATAPGFLRATAKVSVSEGERKTVTLSLTRDPSAPAATATSTPTEAPSAPAAAPTATRTTPESAPLAPPAPAAEPNYTGAYIAWGAGVAGIGIGSALGLMTMSKHAELKDSCAEGVCAPERSGELDEAKRFGNFATIGFGVGAAGLVLGTVLYFTAGSGASDRADVARPRRVLGLTRPRVALGPTHVQLGADF